MDNLEHRQLTKEDYNRMPVYYCRYCGSLKIMTVPQGIAEDYCGECGSTDIGKASIEAWKDLQKTTYKPLYRERPVRTFNPFKNN